MNPMVILYMSCVIDCIYVKMNKVVRTCKIVGARTKHLKDDGAGTDTEKNDRGSKKLMCNMW